MKKIEIAKKMQPHKGFADKSSHAAWQPLEARIKAKLDSQSQYDKDRREMMQKRWGTK